MHSTPNGVDAVANITEFHIPAGKVYLSPIIDCFDGMLVSWTIGTSPDDALVSYGYSEEKLLPHLYAKAIGVLTCLLSEDNELYLQTKEIVDSIKGVPSFLSWRQRLGLIAWKTNKKLFKLFCKATGR